MGSGKTCSEAFVAAAAGKRFITRDRSIDKAFLFDRLAERLLHYVRSLTADN